LRRDDRFGFYSCSEAAKPRRAFKPMLGEF
jgi:hypothetical protein